MFLTQADGLIMGPISKLLGFLLNCVYELSSKLGIVSIGLSIILFTIIVRMCLFPSMLKQSRSSKVQSYVQPELNKITKKYKNKKDQESMMKQQAEVREFQDKYGISLTGGCLSALVQMPIFIALYNVIQNIPAYVSRVKDLYLPIANAIKSDSAAFEKLSEYKESIKALSTIKLNNSNSNTIIDVLAKFDNSSWDAYKELLGNNGAVVDAINSNIDKINDVYSFVGGINLAAAPGFAFTLAFIIPVLSMVFQYLSMNATQSQPQTTGDPTAEATMKSMKTMLKIFPLMTFFICVNAPAGIGLYWATGSLISFITSKCISIYFKNADMEKIVEKAKEKAAKKVAKRKAKGKKTFMEKMQEAAYGPSPEGTKLSDNGMASASLKNYSSSTMKSQNNGVKYREGSLAAKANALQKFNDNNGGKN